MKKTSLKLSALGVLILGASQSLWADESARTLPLFKAENFPAQCDTELAKVKAEITKFENLKIKKNAEAAPYLAQWDKLGADFRDFISPLGLLGNVDPDAALRKAADECEIKVSSFFTDIYQNPKLYAQFKKLKAKDPVDAKLLTEIVEAFEDTGIQLSPEKQKRLKEIYDESGKLSQTYGNNVRENTTKLEFTPAELKGLPDSYIKNLKKNEKGNYLLGFDYPEYLPFMELAENDEARKRYQTAFTRRGTDANIDLMKQAIDLRLELAQLFGRDSYAETALRKRMAKTPETVNAFLSDVHSKVVSIEKSDVEELRQFKAKTLKKPLDQVQIHRWDAGYWSEKLRKEKYSVDQEQLRKYFPVDASQKWLFAISEELYGIKFNRKDVPVWHEEVEFYEVVDSKNGEYLGGLYLDKFPREGKYGHAAVWGVFGGSSLNDRRPISSLVTNFNRNGLNSDELETFVHEMGHALHGILSKTRYVDHSGTSVERDFVEVPSQMFEEWARRAETLSRVADYCVPDCPRVDDKLAQRLKDVKNFGRGMHYARQALYAQYDMALHSADAKSIHPLELWKEMEGKTALGHVEGQQFPGQFNHLMGGYQAGYYSYLWSEVIAMDMLAKFGDTLMNKELGAKYRNTVLSQGSQKTGEQMVKDFLGREADSQAFFDNIVGK
jgi:thimet oligopeptidase